MLKDHEGKDCQYHDVARCARCQGSHSHVLFRQLVNASDEWCWWATCPATGQPILMREVEDKK